MILVTFADECYERVQILRCGYHDDDGWMDVLSTLCGKVFKIVVVYSNAFGSRLYSKAMQELGIVDCSVEYSIALNIVVYSTVLGIVAYNTVAVSFILAFSTGDYNYTVDLN